MESTTIKLSRVTHTRLDKVREQTEARKGKYQTFDDAVEELLDLWEQKEVGVQP